MAGNHAGSLSLQESAALTARITVYSVSVAVILTAVKAVGWWTGGSVALLASLADSALDIISALATFFAVRFAVRPADAEHRFGHGKAEAFSSLLQGALIFASAALIAREAIAHLIRPEPVRAEGWGIVIMLLSLAMTAGLVLMQNRVLARTHSVAIAGDRAHYVSDFVSNIASLLGIGAVALTHNPLWDAMAGLAVALWFAWGAVAVLRDATGHLMDTELGEDERQAICDAVLEDARIRNVHELRTRASGPTIHIQMHIDLDPEQTLREAHTIIEAAEARVMAAFPAADLLIHADPEGFSEPHGVFGEVGRA